MITSIFAKQYEGTFFKMVVPNMLMLGWSGGYGMYWTIILQYPPAELVRLLEKC